MPFTPCLDVTLRVAAVPAAAKAALRLQSEFTELARDPHRWPFRSVRADAEGDVLTVRALLLEPIGDLYGTPAPEGRELAPADVLVALLRANCPSWRALDPGEEQISVHAQRVHRRYWTGGAAPPG
ncbi:MAG: hypothetical protein JWQ18_2293 [Conexibacter sp.]|nr:hypothetical protein [Conexibacter sp.]